MPTSRDETPPALHLCFDRTPEIFATDASGSFSLPLTVAGQDTFSTAGYDEIRLLLSIWYPSSRRSIDLDRTYLEVRTKIHPGDDHWMRLSEVEPVVPAYGGGDAFDGWIVLPVMALQSSYGLFGSGFEPRARIQVRASVFLAP